VIYFTPELGLFEGLTEPLSPTFKKCSRAAGAGILIAATARCRIREVYARDLAVDACMNEINGGIERTRRPARIA
jgi:hypothetical protein